MGFAGRAAMVQVGSDAITSGIEGAWTANDTGIMDTLTCFDMRELDQKSCRCTHLACCWAKEEDMAPDEDGKSSNNDDYC